MAEMNPKKVKICPRCGSRDIGKYPDESGFHFKCMNCNNMFVFELSQEQAGKLEKELKKK